MRLHEISSTGFYIGSKTKLPIGQVLNGRPPQHVDPEEHWVEDVLEMYRPSACLSRNKSVYMVNSPDAELIDQVGGYSNFIYEVMPSDPVERNDVQIWGEIYSWAFEANPQDDIPKEVVELAKIYWAGDSLGEPKWELRCPSIKIIKKVH